LTAVSNRIGDHHANSAALLRQLRQHQAITAGTQHQHTIAGPDCGPVDPLHAAGQRLNQRSSLK